MYQLAQKFVWSATRPRPSLLNTNPAAKGIAFRDVHFPSACTDGIQLSGWLVPSLDAPRGTVILCHGHLGNRLEMLGIAELLSKHHFTTLLFDFRARGMSAGACCTLGAKETCDVTGAVNFLAVNASTSHLDLCVIGNSMGGAAAILAAASDMRIKALVVEAAFARLSESVEQRAKFIAGPFAKQFTAKCREIGLQTEGLKLDIDTVNPIDAIAAFSPRPIMLITDGMDLTCSRMQSDTLFNAASGPKERWIAPAAPHVLASRTYRTEYETRVVGFLNRGLRLNTDTP